MSPYAIKLLVGLTVLALVWWRLHWEVALAFTMLAWSIGNLQGQISSLEHRLQRPPPPSGRPRAWPPRRRPRGNGVKSD